MPTPKKISKSNKDAMIYPKTSANGHAGEYFFAYWISRYFGWPCRLLSVDMGIDAQVEMFADDKKSTGAFISVQIKTTSRKMNYNLSVRVGLDNLSYWNSQHEPVVIALICLNNKNDPEIYWRHLDEETLNAYLEKAKKNKDSKTSINFHYSDNLLVPKDKSMWSKLWMTELDREVIKMAEHAKKAISDLVHDIDCDMQNTGAEEEHYYPTDWERYVPALNYILNDYDEFLRLKSDNKLLVMQYPVVKQYMDLCDLHLDQLLSYFENLTYLFKHESSHLKEEMENCFPVNVQIQSIIKNNIYNY